jgi:cholesterol transport system auxiliary component
MSPNRLVLATWAALTLAACSIGRPVPQPTTYVVEPPMFAREPPIARRPETLRMGNVQVAAAYAGNALVYRLDEARYTSDPYNTFIAAPGALLGHVIADWLDRFGPFSSVAQPGSKAPAAYILEATVTELYGDFRSGRKPAAVLAVQFALIDQTGVRPRLVRERTIARRVDLPRASPEALVHGYSEALAEILLQLASELGT